MRRSRRGFHFEIEGVDVTGTLSVLDTGGWQNWQDIDADSVSITAGAKTLTLVMDSGATSVGNFNYNVCYVLCAGC